MTTRMLLRHFKLDPDKDVKIIQAAGTTRLPAMVAGQLDGTLLGTYDVPSLLESGCCRVLVDMLEMPIDYARFGQVVPTQLLKTKRDLLLKFAEGLIEGVYVFKTNKELALTVLKAEGVKGSEYSYPASPQPCANAPSRDQRSPSRYGFRQNRQVESGVGQRRHGRKLDRRNRQERLHREVVREIDEQLNFQPRNQPAGLSAFRRRLPLDRSMLISAEEEQDWIAVRALNAAAFASDVSALRFGLVRSRGMPCGVVAGLSFCR